MWITRGMVVWSVLGLWIEKRVVCSVCGLVGERWNFVFVN